MKRISKEEIKTVIQETPYNKSPGMDGLTYEFYRKKCDYLLPLLEEVFNAQLINDKLVKSNTIGATRLVSKVPSNTVPTLEDL